MTSINPFQFGQSDAVFPSDSLPRRALGDTPADALRRSRQCKSFRLMLLEPFQVDLQVLNFMVLKSVMFLEVFSIIERIGA